MALGLINRLVNFQQPHAISSPRIGRYRKPNAASRVSSATNQVIPGTVKLRVL